MFRFRRLCIFFSTILTLIILIILIQTKNSHIEILQVKMHVTDGKVRILKLRKIPSERGNGTELVHEDIIHEMNKSQRNNIRQSIYVKLLEDHELRNGELSDADRESPDIVIKYDGSMFGLIDSDPSLHVWRAPFATVGQIWPLPWSVDSTDHIYTLCSWPGSLSFKITGADNSILQHAVRRYKEILCQKKVSFYPANWRQQEHLLEKAKYGAKIFRNTDKFKTRFRSFRFLDAILRKEVRTIYVYVEDGSDQWPSLHMNESYMLSVGVRGVFIRARETWGALRALESVSQLAWRTRAGRVFINETRISDQPRFRHRGVMLDTARHFMPKEVILRNMEAMEMNKMNVFHWHISDDQSFPLVTEQNPELARLGAYDPETKVYRTTDVAEIVEYARLRGIRVIPELDSPSHTLSWRKSHPELMTRCLDVDGRWNGYFGPLNMASESTYRLLRSLFTDLARMFPDRWVHLGSDEVPSGCLLSNQAIQSWMHSLGMSSIDSLTDFYMRKLQKILEEIGSTEPRLRRGSIVWQEALERNSALSSETIVQLWKSQSTSEVVALARRGVSVIYSSCWYLDRLEYGTQWVAHYLCDPGGDGGLEATSRLNSTSGSGDRWRDRILGGEAAMWTEFIDPDNVLPRIWPLASAAAERLWSQSFIKDAEMAAPRLEEMRCRMLMRSIPTGVAGGAGDCGQSEEGHLPSGAGPRGAPNSSLLEVSDPSSQQLMSQLLANVSDLDLPLLLLLILLLCVLFRRYLRPSSRRPALLGALVLGVCALVLLLSRGDL